MFPKAASSATVQVRTVPEAGSSRARAPPDRGPHRSSGVGRGASERRALQREHVNSRRDERRTLSRWQGRGLEQARRDERRAGQGGEQRGRQEQDPGRARDRDPAPGERRRQPAPAGLRGGDPVGELDRVEVGRDAPGVAADRGREAELEGVALSHRRAPSGGGRAAATGASARPTGRCRGPGPARTSRGRPRSAGRRAPGPPASGGRARSPGRRGRSHPPGRRRGMDPTAILSSTTGWRCSRRTSLRASLAAIATSQGRRRSGSRSEGSFRQAIHQAACAASSARPSSPQMTKATRTRSRW